MKIAVENLRPNPFRDTARFPVDQAKVDALVESINTTTFWDNLLARKSPDERGCYQLPYGAHRLKALKKARVEEVDIPVRNLSDTDMARIMARENREEWGATALIEQETVRAVVEGFAIGKIELPKVRTRGGHGAGGHMREAPHFKRLPATHSARAECVYSAESLAKFLGWNESKVEGILNALGAVESGLINREDFDGLTSRQAQEVAVQARRVERETGRTELAQAIGTRLAHGMRSATGRPGRVHPPRGVRQEVTVRTAEKDCE